MSTRARIQTWNAPNLYSGPIYGITAPSNNNTGPGPTLFAFTGSALIQFAPATWIFNVYFNQQNGYYTVVFYDAKDWNGAYVGDNSYVGCHPWPSPSGGVDTSTHKYEISAEGNDWTTDANGYNTDLVTGVWKRQAVRLTMVGGKPYIEFFWDIAAGMDRVIQHPFTNTLDTGTNPGLSFLASPWPSPEDFRVIETMNGNFRNLQLYASALSDANIQAASACNYDGQIASLGLSPWYYNANPKPTDILDKSGNGNHPVWVNNSFTGTLWTGP